MEVMDLQMRLSWIVKVDLIESSKSLKAESLKSSIAGFEDRRRRL
jgi:hypothetical protein